MSTIASPEKHSSRRGILAILVVQMAVLLGVCGAAVAYINWSSAAAQAEFMNALQPPLAAPANFPPSSTPVQAAKVRLPCTGKG